MVHFNLLIHGSKGGLVGHHLAQSDCPAQGDKGKLRCASKMEALFLKSCHFWQCVICLHVSKSNNLLLGLGRFVKRTQNYTDYFFTWRKIFLHKSMEVDI